MLFKFPKKKIVLDCFTDSINAVEYAPILPAIKAIPDWWKKLPDFVLDEKGFKEGTMKHCSGMVEYYKHGVALPLWCDLEIQILEGRGYQWQFSDRKTQADMRAIDRDAKGFLNQHLLFKIVSPWFFRTNESVKWIWSHPTYNYPYGNEIVSLPAVDNYYYQHATNVQMMVCLDKPQTINIPHNTPMAIITPLSDRKIEVVRHLVDEREIKKFQGRSQALSFFASHRKEINQKNKFSSCPYKGKV